MKARHLSLLLALAWMATLFYLSHQPGLPTPGLFPHQDKLIHALAYGLLGGLLLLAQPAAGSRYAIYLSVMIASLYGASDEFHQSFIPGRDADVLDWLADSAGALLATLMITAWLNRRRLADTPAPAGDTQR